MSSLRNLLQRIPSIKQLATKNMKIVFVGDTSVGKTSVMLRYTKDVFEDNYIATTGIDIFSKILSSKNITTILNIVGIAGSQSFSALLSSHIKNANVGVVVYDITNKTSFDNAVGWIDYIRQNNKDNINILLVGNKIDLKNKREVSYSEGKQLASQLNVIFMETSSKTGENISMLFETAVAAPHANSSNPNSNSSPNATQSTETADVATDKSVKKSMKLPKIEIKTEYLRSKMGALRTKISNVKIQNKQSSKKPELPQSSKMATLRKMTSLSNISQRWLVR